MSIDFAAMTHHARDIARYLIGIGFSTDSPEESVLICPLRLQKLLYYCQGWSLALLNRPLFHEAIEAWSYGPVIADVYNQFKGKSDGIRPDEAGESTTLLLESERNVIELVWQHYSGCTPGQLIKKTHDEPAWRDARAGLEPNEKSSNALSLETMKDYFCKAARSMTSRNGFPMPVPSEVWAADEEYERTTGATLQEAILRAKSLRAVA